MYLKRISLLNYKNFHETTFEFDSRINCFVGPNGTGKSNVLDAVYHLAVGKSYFNPLSVQNVRHGEEFFVVEGDFEIEGRQEHVVCSLKKGQKKALKRNGKAYEKFSEHIGLIPIVMISPADRDLITEGSEERRKFIDGVISQLDPDYLRQLIHYQKVLVQRNALLKYFALNHTFDPETLSVYNLQLSSLAQPIYEKRRAFLDDFIPIFRHHHHQITGSAESVQLSYESPLSAKSLDLLLEETLAKDRLLQYTSTGIHRDDLAFSIDEHPIRKFGSQGQQKSFLIALKLAQFDFLKKQCDRMPILLFDDIFDKLDENRVARIIEMVNRDDFGQLFISDTHPGRTETIVSQTGQSYRIFAL